MKTNNIVNTRLKFCKLHLLISIITYIIVCLFGIETSYTMMFGYGIYALCITTILLKSEMRFEGFSLIILFLLGSYLRLTIPTIFNAILADSGVHFKNKYDYTDALFPCAIAMNIYYMLFLLLLTHFSKTNKILNINLTQWLQKKHLLRTVLIFFSWGFLYTIISESFSFGFIGMFFDGFSPMALLILAFVSVYSPKKEYYYIFCILIIFEIIRNVVWGFYKGAIIQPVFIFAIRYYLYYRYNGKTIFTLKSVLLLMISIVFMLGFVYPFMTAKRSVAGWDSTNGVTQDLDIKELIVTLYDNREFLVNENQSNELFSRFDALSYNAYFYKLVQRDGINPIVLYASLRQFWPKWLGRNTDEDVLMKPGYIVNSYREYGYLRKLDFYNSDYIGAFASGYFWGWWFGVIIVCFFNAFIISNFLKYSLSHSTHVLSMLVITGIVLESFSCYEEVKSGGLSRAIIWSIYIVVIKINFSHKKLRYV